MSDIAAWRQRLMQRDPLHSGMGREGGHQGIEDFTELKYFCIGGLDPRKPAARGLSA